MDTLLIPSLLDLEGKKQATFEMFGIVIVFVITLEPCFRFAHVEGKREKEGRKYGRGKRPGL